MFYLSFFGKKSEISVQVFLGNIEKMSAICHAHIKWGVPSTYLPPLVLNFFCAFDPLCVSLLIYTLIQHFPSNLLSTMHTPAANTPKAPTSHTPRSQARSRRACPDSPDGDSADYRIDFFASAKRLFNEGVAQGFIYSWENGILEDPIPWYWYVSFLHFLWILICISLFRPNDDEGQPFAEDQLNEAVKKQAIQLGCCACATQVVNIDE